MRIDFHRSFDKQYKNLSIKQKKQFAGRLVILTIDKSNTILNNHTLKGKYLGYRSINITGDVRAIYIEHKADHLEFVYIGTHNQLYG